MYMIFPRFTCPCIPGHCVFHPIIIYDLLSMNGGRERKRPPWQSVALIFLFPKRKCLKRGDVIMKWGRETLNANEGRGMKCKLWNEKKDFISDKRNKLLQLHSGGSDKTLSGENKLQKVYKKSTAFSTPPQHSRSNEWKLISQSGTAWN